MRCCIICFTWVELLFQRNSLFSIEFDLWSSLAKKAILSVVLYFIVGTKRHKLVLDTLPLVNELSHDRHSYQKSITAVLQRYQIDAMDKLVCMTTDGASVNFATALVMDSDIQGCSAHLLVLLVKDICDIGHVWEVMEMCMSINSLFGHSTINIA